MAGWGLRFDDAGAIARIWAPSAGSVSLITSDRAPSPLQRTPEGWHEARATVQPGDRYQFEIDGLRVPDPASRAQPDGPEGWSQAVALDQAAWRCPDWRGRPWRESVVYELHVGTFSRAGTFLGAIEHLDDLAELGITVIELMPVACFPGARNWGYDGVLPFAPDASYGTPAELQRLVDACHERSLSIVLDVVYNHFGPASSYIEDYAPEFFTERYRTPWGPAINFDGEQSAAVRAFYVENARQWIEDYRFDGLRIDAVQAIMDESTPHILDDIRRCVRDAAGDRQVHLMLENDRNEAHWLNDGYDGQWNDDFHHVMRVLLAHQTDGYFADYAADPVQHLGRALTQGFSYQGQESQHRPGLFRGTPSGHLPPTAFVNFLQNHDQVGNAPYGKRLCRLTSVEAVRLGAAVLLLAPGIPMLFMGEEWAAGTPFDFFVDYEGKLADAVRQGRRDEFKRFDAFQSEAALDRLSDPVAADTMAHSALDWSKLTVPEHAEILALHRQLLRVRAETVLPLLTGMRSAGFTALSDRAIEARWTSGGQTLALAANFAPDPVPYRAPPAPAAFTIGPDDPERLAGWGFRLTLTGKL